MSTQALAVSARKTLFSDNVLDQLRRALPSFLTAERFARVFYSAMVANPRLFETTPESQLSCLIQSAQLGLEPLMGRAYLIPRKNRRKQGFPVEMQFQPGYLGLMDLARRTNNIIIKAHVVHANDTFSVEYGDTDQIVHKPCIIGEPGPVLGAYTVWEYENGMRARLFMTTAQIEAVRRRSESADKGPWVSDWDAMAMKTVIKRCAKFQPLSTEMAMALDLDNAVESGEPPSQGFIPDGEELPLPVVAESEPETEPAPALEELPKQGLDAINIDTQEAELIEMERRATAPAAAAPAPVDDPYVDASGERYDPDKHAWNKVERAPSKTADGLFRRRRRTVANSDAPSPAAPPPAPEAEAEDPFASVGMQ